MEWSKLKPEVWKKMATAIGDEDLADIMTIAMVDNSDYVATNADVKFTGVERARLNIAINVARKQMATDMEISDVFAIPKVVLPIAASHAAASASSTPTGAGVAPLEEGIVKDSLKVAQYFDQGCKSKEVRPAPPEIIDEMRARWEQANGSEPVAELQFTDNQLSVLYRLNHAGHNMLAFDMGVWGHMERDVKGSSA